MNIQIWFPLRLTSLISLLSKELSRVFSKTTVQKHQFLGTQASLWSNSHIHTWLMEKSSIQLDGPLLAKLLNMLSKFVIVLLWISWLQPPSTVILESRKIKSFTVSIVAPTICHDVMRSGCQDLSFFKCWALSQLLCSPLSPHQEAL